TGLYVRAFEVWVERLSARGKVFDPIHLRIQATHEGQECRLPPGCCGDELIYLERAPRILLLPSRDPVDDVAFYPSVPLVDGAVRAFLGQGRLPVRLTPSHAEGVPPRLRFVEV